MTTIGVGGKFSQIATQNLRAGEKRVLVFGLKVHQGATMLMKENMIRFVMALV